jgi:hypothetical protein
MLRWKITTRATARVEAPAARNRSARPTPSRFPNNIGSNFAWGPMAVRITTPDPKNTMKTAANAASSLIRVSRLTNALPSEVNRPATRAPANSPRGLGPKKK